MLVFSFCHNTSLTRWPCGLIMMREASFVNCACFFVWTLLQVEDMRSLVMKLIYIEDFLFDPYGWFWFRLLFTFSRCFSYDKHFVNFWTESGFEHTNFLLLDDFITKFSLVLFIIQGPRIIVFQLFLSKYFFYLTAMQEFFKYIQWGLPEVGRVSFVQETYPF